MEIPEINRQDSNDALKYNEDNGVSSDRQEVHSTDMNSDEQRKMLEKDDQEEENSATESSSQDEHVQQPRNYKNPYSYMLENSKNLIFHGAPGTGKTYLAKEIAADIISNGQRNYANLLDEEKQQVEFVQFHPSYDYTDFVEGLRPVVKNGTMGFKLRKGIFKKFVDLARKNYEDSEDFEKSEDSQETTKGVENNASVMESINEFLSYAKRSSQTFETSNGNKFVITDYSSNDINISIPDNPSSDSVKLKVDKLKTLLESEQQISQVKDIPLVLEGEVRNTYQPDSYYYAIYKEITYKESFSKVKTKVKEQTKTKTSNRKKYIFIIDEINRGEISKIFGELFFAIDPGYRGKDGEISTQYAYMHSDPNEKFYIPENVYIIGTMNDIDRSVDSFDFAMRRRFRFVELKANASMKMLNSLDNDKRNEAIQRMKTLNEAIVNVQDLNENYQIGAAYFLKLKDLKYDFNQLWTDYLQPLLQDYVHGMHKEDDIMEDFENAYNMKPTEDDANDAVQD